MVAVGDIERHLSKCSSKPKVSEWFTEDINTGDIYKLSHAFTKNELIDIDDFNNLKMKLERGYAQAKLSHGIILESCLAHDIMNEKLYFYH